MEDRYQTEVDRREDVEREHADDRGLCDEREKEWREQDSLRAAAIKDRRDTEDDRPLYKNRRRLGVGGDELLDDGRDLFAPLAAVKDAVMADALGEQIFLLRSRELRGQVERRLGLADAADIVAFALDGKQAPCP